MHMTFSIYDVLAQLIPGFMVYLTMTYVLGYEWDKDYILAITAISYVLGYFINTLGSWLEGLYFWSWRGAPWSRLLEGKDIFSVRFYAHEEILGLLKLETTKQNIDFNELYSIAFRFALGVKDTRIEVFNANYALSRNILTASIIIFIILLFDVRDSYRYIFLSTVAIIVSWQRCKERGYYLSKEVLMTYLRLKIPIKPIGTNHSSQ